MSISIEFLREEELDHFVSVIQSGFIDGIGSVLTYGGAASNPESHAAMMKDQQKYVSMENCRTFKAVDSSTGEIVAVSRWLIYTREHT